MVETRYGEHRPVTRLELAWGPAIGVGVVAAVVMGLFVMVAESFGDAEGFWAPMVYIAAVALRGLQDVGANPGFLAGPVVLGALLHLATSLVLSLAFIATVPRWVRWVGNLMGVGLAYGVVVFAVAWFVVLPVADPVLLRVNGGWFALAHVLWGLLVGYGASMGARVTYA